jgi:hypothetical protein
VLQALSQKIALIDKKIDDLHAEAMDAVTGRACLALPALCVSTLASQTDRLFFAVVLLYTNP